MLYKGYKSSANYDGEPSVSNGIMYQLRSYTECPLSFLTGSCPTERTTAGYSSCLYLDFTDLPLPQGTDFPWTLTLPHFAGLCDDAVPVALHRYRVSFQNPARLRNYPEPGRALE